MRAEEEGDGVMREWIPSKAVREYMEKRGKVLSDFDKAALAWHHPDMRFRERTATLKKIMEATQDRELSGQIQERLAHDRKCRETFFEKREGRVFTFCAYSEEDREWESYGYYATGELAYDYGKKSGGRFHLEKYQLIQGSEDTKGTGIDIKESPMVSALYYDEKGELDTYFSTEIEWAGKLEEDTPGRFENSYVDILYPFRRGDLVRKTGSTEVGVAETERDDAEYEKNRVKWARRREMGCCNEYDGTYIVIEYMDAQGRFSHTHVPAAEVEYAKLDENDPKGEALQHASWLLKGEGSIDAFQMVCERLAEK